MHWTRRQALSGSLAGLALALGRRSHAGTGELVAGTLLDLPQGYRATLVDQAGGPTTDGFRLPGRPDGMACWLDEAGRYVLVRNHELGSSRSLSAWGEAPLPDAAFDPERMGAVSRVVIDPDTLSPVSTNLVLAGTDNNCAGGVMPEGWVSCEESERPGHGWAFLCPHDAAQLQPREPLRSWGRFKREGIAFDVETGLVWQTEDHGVGVFYRHVPDTPADPFTGTLQALVVRGRPDADMNVGFTPGDQLAVSWIDVPDASAAEQPTREQARSLGAAVFCRNEGICRLDGSVVFATSLGGPHHAGQIWSLRGDVLTLLHQVGEDRSQLSNPDNLATTPWGAVVAAEDNYDVDEGGPANHLRILEPDGRVWTLARSSDRSELAGPCFSPDGRVLFVNLQKRDMTVAITGPFPIG